MSVKPTVGRIVHYTNLGDADGKFPPEIRAALITGAKRKPAHECTPGGLHAEDDYEVDLHILYRTGQFDMQNVPWWPEAKPGHWTWPERTT